MLAKGRKNPKTGLPEVRFFAGEGVSAAAFEEFKAFIERPHYTILHTRGLEKPANALSLIDELTQRDYDLATFSFSIYKLGTGAPVNHKNLRMLKTTPGRLVARWSRQEWDEPDLCTCWHKPCHRGDSALLVGCFSDRLYLDWNPASLFPEIPGEGREFLKTMQRHLFDKRTIRVQVDHKGRAAALAALAEAQLQG